MASWRDLRTGLGELPIGALHDDEVAGSLELRCQGVQLGVVVIRGHH